MREIPSTIVHFYRATVMHADVWRQRLDATTNWAVVSTAAIVTFAFSQPENPHFILLLAIVFGSFFLSMESRRYQMYNLWRQRVQMLNRYVVAPALAPESAPSDEEVDRELGALAVELGSTVPHLSFVDALGYRLRRNYANLFAAVVATWVLKVWYHPNPAASWDIVVERAQIGGLSGLIVMSAVGVFMVVVTFLALRARTEQMRDWTELPSPLGRALRGGEMRQRETSLVSEAAPRKFEPEHVKITDMLALRRGEDPISTATEEARTSESEPSPSPRTVE